MISFITTNDLRLVYEKTEIVIVSRKQNQKGVEYTVKNNANTLQLSVKYLGRISNQNGPLRVTHNKLSIQSHQKT